MVDVDVKITVLDTRIDIAYVNPLCDIATNLGLYLIEKMCEESQVDSGPIKSEFLASEQADVEGVLSVDDDAPLWDIVKKGQVIGIIGLDDRSDTKRKGGH